MVVRTAAHQPESIAFHALSQRFSVHYNLLLVLLELRLERFLEAHRLGSNNVHQRSALNAWEHVALQLLCVFLLGHDQAAAWTAQGLVRGGGHKVCMRNGIRMTTGGHEAGDVGDVRQQHRAAVTGDLAHALEINHARICAGAHRDHAGLMLSSHGGELIVINPLILLVNPVMDDLKKFAGEIRRVAVSEVAAMTEIHGQKLVSRLEHGKVHAHVRAAAGVRLHVHIIAAKHFLGARNSQFLGHVHMLAAAIPALAGITFGVLVGKH